LKKFSLKIPFKTFHASADVAAAPASSARIVEKMFEKVFRKNDLTRKQQHHGKK
jgi:hypothetical protein